MVEGPLLDIRKRYKDGTYSFTTTVPFKFEQNTFVSKGDIHTGYQTVLKLDVYPKDLVIDLAQKGQLIAFEEVLPKVSDIFIDIVQNGPKHNTL